MAASDKNVSRREFIGSATLTTAGVATGLSFYFSRPHRNEEEVARLEKAENQVRLGFIGVGNRGMSLLRSALQVPGSRAVAIAACVSPAACSRQPVLCT